MAVHTPPHPALAVDLALAVVASSAAPLLLLDGGLIVIAASTSFCRAFRLDPVDVPGRQIFRLGTGEWDIPQLRSLLAATVSGHTEIEAYEMDLRSEGREARRLVLNAQMLDYADTDNARLLLTVSDVTEVRIGEKLKDDLMREKDDLLRDKDNLLREKAILLQEVQHRVANSLQIIASVLLQNARKVQSEETRLHLHDAHQRVMSVAVLQQQLAASRLGNVALRAYFTDLCGSLGASMIHDHKQISLDVSADESAVSADVSIALGLIVTELVINALKHAFPGGRQGKIKIDYRADGPDWRLCVADDGIGILSSPAAAKPGLGTSIVEALASQLRARIWVADTKPGTAVSIVHETSGPGHADADAQPVAHAV